MADLRAVAPVVEANPMLEAALQYAAQGWKVFPCDPDGTLNHKGEPSKEPIGWLAFNGYKSATTDPATIRKWWRRAPNANIGLALEPSGLVAADADLYKPDCAWHELVQGREIPATFEQSTPRGGWHYVFKDPGGVAYADYPPGVEMKHNGYILLEPSRVGGKQYRVECDDDPAPAPAWLPRKSDQEDDGEPGKGRDNDQLDTLLASIGPGNRHEPITRAIASMIGRGYSDWLIHKVLAPYYGGDDTAEVQRLIKGGRDSWFKPDPGEPGEVTIGDTEQRPRSGTAADLKDKVFPPLKYVVPGYVPEGLFLFAGRPKLGKSWMVLDWCLSVAWGGTAMNSVRCEQGATLYCALEDNERRLQDRLARIIPDPRTPWPRAFEYWTDMARLDQGGEDQIREWIEQADNPRLVVVDTLAKVERPRGKSEDAYASKHAALKGLHRIASDTGVAIVAVTHVTKSEYASGDPFERITGSLGGIGTADTGGVLDRDASGNCTLYVRGRDIEEVESAVQFSKASCLWSVLGDASTVHVSVEREAILSALQGAALGPKEVADAAGLKHGSVKHTLRKMVEAGQVEKTTRGKYQLPEVNEGHSPRSPHSPFGPEPAEHCATATVNGAPTGVHRSGGAFTDPPWRRPKR